MIRRTPPVLADCDLDTLQQRARRQQSSRRQLPVTRRISAVALPAPDLSTLPTRYLLHLLIALILPVSMLATPRLGLPGTVLPLQPWPQLGDSDFRLPPIALGNTTGEQPVPNAAFAAIDALPQPVVSLPRSEVFAPLAVQVALRSPTLLRGGPGTAYDQVGEAMAGEQLTLIGRHGDWLQGQLASGAVVWLATEAVQASLAQLSVLHEPANILPPPPPKVARVSQEGLNLRDGPGTAYVGMTTLPAGQDLTLLARYVNETGDWFQVLYGERTGWVSSEFLRFQPGVAERIGFVEVVPDPNPALVGSVRSDTANLRAGPATAFGKQATLAAGAALDLLGRHQDWFKVRATAGEGWIFRDLVDVSDYIARRVPQVQNVPVLPRPVARPAAPSQPGAPAQPAPAAPIAAPAPPPAAFSGDLVSFALQFRGAPYVWGGESPAGFDCSGFTRYVYRQVGLNLPHSAAGQYSTAYGAAIGDTGSLAPGDLVFFANTYKAGISHVGIYIGGGNVVQALSPGYGVGVASIHDGYWAQHFYGAIRPGL